MKNGFTLIELMVVIAVLAIVLGVAVPSFTQQIRNNGSVALTSEFQAALGLARSEAVKRSSRVSVCPSSDGANCLTANDWNKGWIVFVDNAPSDSTASVTVGDVLKYWSDIDQSATITAKKGTTSLAYVRFTGAGILARTSATDNAERSFEISLSKCTSTNARKVVIGFSGMLSTSKVACK